MRRAARQQHQQLVCVRHLRKEQSVGSEFKLSTPQRGDQSSNAEPHRSPRVTSTCIALAYLRRKRNV